MLYSEAKKKAAGILMEAGVEEAGVDAEYLLLQASGYNRSTLFMKLFEEIPDEVLQKYHELIDRRASREPLQYILGNQVFMGYMFIVTPDVLIPRFDTEVLAENAIKRAEAAARDRDSFRILDLCTGSGCVATSVGLELAKNNVALGKKINIEVTGADISEAAIDVAKKNWSVNYDELTTTGLKDVSVNARFIISDLFGSVEGKFEIITANPPYIVREEIQTLSPEITEHEPHLALDGGDDGMDFYRRICMEAPRYLTPGGRLLMEFDDAEAEPVAEMMKEAGFKDIEIHRDLAGLRRVVEGVIREEK